MRIRKRIQLYFGLCKWYGQRKEDKIIAGYFGNFRGTLLSIGENDGQIYSNVLYFIKRGWVGDLVEPSPLAFKSLFHRHLYRDAIYCHQIAIGATTGTATFWESGSLVNLGDRSLVSSLDSRMVSQWPNTRFIENKVHVLSFNDYMTCLAQYRRYDLISIDAEGLDYAILEQMDLIKLGCKCLIVEPGSHKGPFIKLVTQQGFHVLATTEENIIFVVNKP